MKGYSQRLTFDYVYNQFEQNGCKLLDNQYINAQTKMKYICKCGEESKINYNKFQQGRRCKKCGIKKMIKSQQKIFNTIKNFIENENYTLITKEYEYKNSRKKLDLICLNSHKCSINWDNFKFGFRCRRCWFDNNYGENHPSWNPNRDEINLNAILRIPKGKSWITKHMKQDPLYNDYIQDLKISKKSNYHLDHIIPVNLFVKLVIHYNLDKIKVKKIINNKNNYQLLTKKDNLSKFSKGNIFEAAQYLMVNGIKLK